MGPWTVLPGDLACVASAADSQGVPTPGQGCLYGGSTEVSATRAQQNFVLTVPGGEGSDPAFVWTGDRWQQAPDGIKGHEGQFWAPLSFDEHGRVGRVSWLDNFTLQVPTSVA